MTVATPQTRDEVLKVLGRLVNLRWRGLDTKDIPIQFLGQRIAVVLPADKFTNDEQIRLDGKFQHLMTQRNAHAFLDFVPTWSGLETPMDGGFH